jgi:hypothetical protein
MGILIYSMEREMKKLWLILIAVLFSASQAWANGDFDGFDSIETITSADCPNGPYPIQPVGSVAGSFRFLDSSLDATLTVWRYPCSQNNSAIIATIDVAKGSLISTGFGLREAGASSSSVHHAFLKEYRTGQAVLNFITGKKSYLIEPAGGLNSSLNTNAALVLTHVFQSFTINIPAYRASDYSPDTPVTPGPTRDHTGQWANASETGWGLTVLQNFANAKYIFVPWYTYDKTGKNAWYLFQGDTWMANDVFSADVYSYSGPPFGPTYNSNQFGGDVVGTAKLTFNSATSARFEYTVDGISRSMNLIKLE